MARSMTAYGRAVGSTQTKNITVENYRILNGAGYGITSMYTENISIDGSC